MHSLRCTSSVHSLPHPSLHHPHPQDIGPNDRNQEAIGSTAHALSSLVALCDGQQSEDMRRYASDALAVLSITKENRDRMEQVQPIFTRMIDLCSMDNTPEIQRNAAAALGNMSFNHMGNQTTIGDSGGIEALCTLCGLSLDVDVLENSTAALVNLSRSHEQNGKAVVVAVVAYWDLTVYFSTAVLLY